LPWPLRTPTVNYITNISELPPHFINELRNYFEQYKVLENKEVYIEDFQDQEEAYKIIRDSIELYKKNFPG
jgi:inorganic pyrophosphatase